MALVMENYDKQFTLEVLCALCITEYNLGSFFPGEPIDFGEYTRAIVKHLRKLGTTLQEIDAAIVKYDFTGTLTHVGSGDRERGFVMEYIEEIYIEEIYNEE